MIARIDEIELNEVEVIQLQILLRIARGVTQDGRRVMRQCAESGGNPMISVSAAEKMAEAYKVNMEAATRLLERLDGAGAVFVQY